MPWITLGAAAVGAAANYASSQNSGDESTATGATSQQTSGQGQSTYVPNAGTQDLYGYLMGQGQQLATEAVPYYPGQGYVSPSEMTQQGVNMLGNSGDAYSNAADYYKQGGQMATYASPLYNKASNYSQQGANMMANSAGAMQGINQTAGNNYNFLSGAADVANNPYVQGQLAANQRSVMDTLNNQALPGLQAGSVGVNSLGSSRLGLAQGQAIGDSMTGLANANASTMLNAYGQGLSAQQNALGQTSSQLSNQLAPGQAIMAGGAGYETAGNQMGQSAQAYQNAGSMLDQSGNSLGRGAAAYGQGGQTVEGYQEAALQDSMNRYNYQYTEPWTRIGNVSNLLGTLENTGTSYTSSTGTQSGTSSGTSTGADADPWASAISGGVTGAGIGSQIVKNRNSTNKTTLA